MTIQCKECKKEKEHQARGLCHTCYNRTWYNTVRAWSTFSDRCKWCSRDDRKHHSLGYCVACYSDAIRGRPKIKLPLSPNSLDSEFMIRKAQLHFDYMKQANQNACFYCDKKLKKLVVTIITERRAVNYHKVCSKRAIGIHLALGINLSTEKIRNEADDKFIINSQVM